MKDIGLLLRQTREERGLAIVDAAADLKIRQHYLEVIENGEASSLSDEIYVIGYIKSYANWLGINGSKLVAKLKKEHNDLSISGSISNDSSAFFNSEDYCVNPNVRLVLLSLIVVTIIYSAFSVGSTPFDDDAIYSFSKPVEGFANLKGDGKQFILMANDDLSVYMTSAVGKKTEKQMQAGEVYFLPSGEDSLVTSDKPAALDVFIDQKEDSFLGTLASLK